MDGRLGWHAFLCQGAASPASLPLERTELDATPTGLGCSWGWWGGGLCPAGPVPGPDWLPGTACTVLVPRALGPAAPQGQRLLPPHQGQQWEGASHGAPSGLPRGAQGVGSAIPCPSPQLKPHCPPVLSHARASLWGLSCGAKLPPLLEPGAQLCHGLRSLTVAPALAPTPHRRCLIAALGAVFPAGTEVGAAGSYRGTSQGPHPASLRGRRQADLSGLTPEATSSPDPQEDVSEATTSPPPLHVTPRVKKPIWVPEARGAALRRAGPWPWKHPISHAVESLPCPPTTPRVTSPSLALRPTPAQERQKRPRERPQAMESLLGSRTRGPGLRAMPMPTSYSRQWGHCWGPAALSFGIPTREAGVTAPHPGSQAL